MKHLLTSLCMTFALAGFGAASVPLRWTVETSRITPVSFDVFRGEEIRLDATLLERGTACDLTGNVAKLYWQTNGMATAFWTTNAVVTATNHLTATFTGDMDPGAPVVSGFIGIEGKNYRASFTLKFRHSPGAHPNEIQMPPRQIDFASVIVTNAPWLTEHQPLTNYYTRAQTDAKIVELAPAPGNYAAVSNNAMNAVTTNEWGAAYVKTLLTPSINTYVPPGASNYAEVSSENKLALKSHAEQAESAAKAYADTKDVAVKAYADSQITAATNAISRIVTSNGHSIVNADLTADTYGFYDATAGVWTVDSVAMFFSPVDSYDSEYYSYYYWYSTDRSCNISLYVSRYSETSYYWSLTKGGKYYSTSVGGGMATSLSLEGYDYDTGSYISATATRSDYNRMGKHRIALAEDATNAAVAVAADRPTTTQMSAAINAKAAYYVQTSQLSSQMKPIVAGWAATNTSWNTSTDPLLKKSDISPIATAGDLHSLRNVKAITEGQYQCCIMSNGTQVTYEMQYNDGEVGNVMGRMLDVYGSGFSFNFNAYQKANTNVVGSVTTNFLSSANEEWEGTGILPTGFQPMVVVTFNGWLSDRPCEVDVFGPWRGNSVVEFDIQGDSGTPESVTLSNTVDFSPNSAGKDRLVSSRGLAHQLARQNKALKTFWTYDLTNRLNNASFDLSTDEGKTAALTAVIRALGGTVE